MSSSQSSRNKSCLFIISPTGITTPSSVVRSLSLIEAKCKLMITFVIFAAFSVTATSSQDLTTEISSPSGRVTKLSSAVAPLGVISAAGELDVSRTHANAINLSSSAPVPTEQAEAEATVTIDRPFGVNFDVSRTPFPTEPTTTLKASDSTGGETPTIAPPAPQDTELTNTIVVTNAAPVAPSNVTVWPDSGLGERHRPPSQKSARAKFSCASADECNNGALCHHGICFCLPGFTGDSCSTNIDECRQFSADGGEPACLNGATCVDEINSFSCRCAPGFQGERCQDEVDLCAELAPCLNGARCANNRGTSYTCHCAPGWQGARCEHNIDECAPRPCANKGTCRDLVNGFQCDCQQGWAGAQCELNIDDCALGLCAPNSSVACVDLVNDYQCQCAPGFAGKNCQLDVDECAQRPCANGSKCIDLINGFRCDCLPGFRGARCELDVNECERQSPPICHNGGQCENFEPGYKCHCRDGWTGRNCLEIGDYCRAKRPCGQSGVCRNTNSSLGSPFQCDCQSSHIGPRCELRRNCTNECHPEHGHCVKNTTMCVCQPPPSTPATGGAKGTRSMCERLTGGCAHFAAGALCLNGGLCVDRPHNAEGYECLCGPDFHGPICQFEGADSAPLDLVLLTVIGSVCVLLGACAIASVLIFRSVRKARATRGTYSPSSQEKFESSAPHPGDFLKPPVPERLI